MDKLHIVPSELLIAPEAPVPIEVQDALLRFHIFPVNRVRSILGVPVWASQNSGFRPEAWERKQGRVPGVNGRTEWSAHTFKKTNRDPDGKGAVDWTTKREEIFRLGTLLESATDYTRIFFYPDNLFFHCDYAFAERGRRLFLQGDRKERTKKEWYNSMTDALL